MLIVFQIFHLLWGIEASSLLIDPPNISKTAQVQGSLNHNHNQGSIHNNALNDIRVDHALNSAHAGVECANDDHNGCDGVDSNSRHLIEG